MVNNQANNQAGVALITVLVIVALIGFSVNLMLKRQKSMIDDIKIVNQQADAVEWLFSLEEFAKDLLSDDANKEVDWYDEKNNDNDFLWWSQKQSYDFDNGQFEAQWFDLQAGINLNNLFKHSKQAGQLREIADPDFFGCFNRLNLEFDSNITADSFMVHLNEQNLRVVTHRSQLKDIRGINLKDYAKIKPFLFVSSARNIPININTAEKEVLMCLNYNISAEVAEKLIGGRPYRSTKSFRNRLKNEFKITLTKSNDLFSVNSNYFVLKATITVNDLVLKTISTFNRPKKGKISLINRSYYLDN